MRDRPEPGVVAWAAAQLGWPPDATEVERLTGGYSWQSYRLVWKRQMVVLRVAPNGGPMDPYDASAEAARLAAVPKSVPTPKVLAVDVDGVGGRPCVLLQHIGGTTIQGDSALSTPDQDRCRLAFAQTLAAIHRDGSTADLSDAATITNAYARAIEQAVDQYRRASTVRNPGFEVGLRWMLTFVPRTDLPPVLCHGDYRLSNLVWRAPGMLSGVLDWERSWVGDPMTDVAFTRMSGGWCAIEGAGQVAYETAMGEVIDERRLAFALRFERWRRNTLGMRALRAHAEGRTDDPRLERMGRVGVAGAWDLVDLLADGPLVPLPDVHWPSEPADVSDLDPDDVWRVLDDLALHADTITGLRHALSAPDPVDAFADAHGVLTAAAASGGAELIEPLRALGRCARVRLNQMRERQWR